MRPHALAFLIPVAAAAPLAAQGSTQGSTSAVARTGIVTWSGPTPACRLDQCGPNVARACLLALCAPDSTRTATRNGSLVVKDTAARPVRPLDAARADSARRSPALPQRPRR